MTKYIGIIYWKDNSGVLDNTTESQNLQSVWKQCCQANKLHAGEIVIRKAEYNEDGQVIGDAIIRFDNVEDCQHAFNTKYQKD